MSGRNPGQGHGFYHRYALPLLAVFAVILGGLGTTIIRSQRALLDQEVDRNLIAAAHDLSSRALVSFLLDDGAALQQEIQRTLAQSPDSRFGVFVKLDGQVAAQSSFDAIPDRLLGETGVTFEAEDTVDRIGGYVVATVPVIDGTGTLRGRVSVGSSVERLEAALRQALYKLIGLTVVAFALLALLAGKLTSRIEALTQNLERRVEERTAELATARDRAMDASRMKSEFLANMSHEIRTPMHGVTALSELLLTTDLDERQRKYAGTLHRSGHMLLAILNDILDISKIEAGKLEVEWVNFDPEVVVTDALELQRERAVEKDLSLTLTCDGTSSGLLVGDPVRIGQVVSNLIANAIKFTEQGEVEVTLAIAASAEGKSHIRVAVRDTGIGISEEYQESLYDPFTQEDASTTRRFGGSGLGLAICRRLVALMGGTIDFESESGKGSLFWFELTLEGAPIVDEASGQLENAKSGRPPPVRV